LREHFKTRKLRLITHGDIERYKTKRLTTTTVRKKPRSITSVNRELQLMRAMFNVAAREGWIIKNPFISGKSLISVADERQRERILAKEEEERLLAACTGKRAHLLSIIICALDTGCRQGEILKLKWEDVDFDNRILTIQSLNTKTLRERHIAMTERLTLQMESLYKMSSKDAGTLVFGISNNVKRSFNTVRKAAGLMDVRFHDLRHTHATRLVGAHLPLAEVGRILGHTQSQTTYRYTNANIETARRAAAALDEFNKVDKAEKRLIH
jgi:integrase